MSITRASTNVGNAQRVQYAFGGHSADTVNGQGGYDTYQFDTGFGDYDYDWDASDWALDGTRTGGVAEVNFKDMIYGTASNQTLDGLGGNDALDGVLNHRVDINTPHLIAAYAIPTRATARFDAENLRCKAQRKLFRSCTGSSSVKTPHASPGGLAGHKGLGSPMDSAWAGVYGFQESAFTCLQKTSR